MDKRIWLILGIAAAIVVLPLLVRLFRDILFPVGRGIGRAAGSVRRGYDGLPQSTRRVFAVAGLLLAVFVAGYLWFAGSRLAEIYAAQYPEVPYATETSLPDSV